MADKVDATLMTQEDYDIESETFISNYQSMIQWSEERWEKDIETSSQFEFAVKNLRYWSSTLKAASGELMVLLAVFSNGRLRAVSEKIWIQFLKKINALEYFQNFYYVRNNNIIGIQFSDVRGKQMVVESYSLLREGFIIDLDWYYALKTTFVRIHWLPKGFYTEELKLYVSKFVEILELNYEESFKENESYPINVVSIKGILRVSNVDLIPHLATFMGLQTLIVVSGRRPMCLRCECIGHKAARCDKIFCKDCKILHMVEYKCEVKQKRVDTYAERLKNYKDAKANLSSWPALAEKQNRERETPSALIINDNVNLKQLKSESGNNYVVDLQICTQSTEKLNNQISEIQGIINNLSGAETGPASQSVSGESKLDSESAIRDVDQTDVSKMDFKTTVAKRKLETLSSNNNAALTYPNTTVKTYGSVKKKSTISVSASNNLFDALTDHVSTFSD